jgi:hypothetical protein
VDPWGTADKHWGIAMSTLVLDTRPIGHAGTMIMRDERTGGTHPRGRGFHVLTDDDYAPRHRLDVPAQLDLAAALAS